MPPKVLVLGANFAGLTAALSVKQELGDDVDVTVVSKSDRFQFNPSFIWIPFGKRKQKDVVFPVAKTFESRGVEFIHGEATSIDPEAKKVATGRTLADCIGVVPTKVVYTGRASLHGLGLRGSS